MPETAAHASRQATGLLVDPDGQAVARALRARRRGAADRRRSPSQPTRDADSRSTASTARCARRRSRPAGTPTPGRRRSVDWQRRGARRRAARSPVRSDPCLFAGVTQRIAVSGTTPRSRVLLPSTAVANDRRCRSSRAAAACQVHLRRDAVAPAEPPTDPRALGVLVGGFDYVPTRAREDRRRRLAAVASAHRRRQLHPRLAARPRRGRRARRRRVRAGEPARQARDRARARGHRASSARCRSCRRRTRCAPPGAASDGRPAERVARRLRRPPLQRLDVSAAAARACARR